MYASAWPTPLCLVYRTFVLSHPKRYDGLFASPSIIPRVNGALFVCVSKRGQLSADTANEGHDVRRNAVCQRTTFTIGGSDSGEKKAEVFPTSLDLDEKERVIRRLTGRVSRTLLAGSAVRRSCRRPRCKAYRLLSAQDCAGAVA